MLRLNCFIKVSGQHHNEVIAAATRLTLESLRQDGCIAYDIFESATRPEVLMICETWRDQAALDAHSASEVFAKEVGIMRSLAELTTDRFEL